MISRPNGMLNEHFAIGNTLKFVYVTTIGHPFYTVRVVCRFFVKLEFCFIHKLLKRKVWITHFYFVIA